MGNLNKIEKEIMNCKKCPLHYTRNKVVVGEGDSNANIMFVGEAPGKVNDEVGRPFVGHGGKIFDGILADIGIKRKDVFITNIIKCWPPDNRKPKKTEINSCLPYLENQIELISPKIIFALGLVAFNSITDKKIKMKENHGESFFISNFIVVPTFHPNAIRYVKGGKNTIIQDIRTALIKINLIDPLSNNQQLLFDE